MFQKKLTFAEELEAKEKDAEFEERVRELVRAIEESRESTIEDLSHCVNQAHQEIYGPAPGLIYQLNDEYLQ